MDAIEILMDEHQLILRALDALEVLADGMARGGDDRAELARFVRFIREFADARHHAKEEGVLFEAMIRAGFPRQAGPVAVMLMDHDAGRAYVAVMGGRAAQPVPWTDAERQEAIDAARGYAGLLRSHIRKEDGILYPMARQRLSAEAMAGVDRDCAAYEAKESPRGEDSLRALGAELVARHARSAA